MEDLGIAVLGCADIAWRRMIPAIVSSDLRLVAVASRSGEKARRFAERFGCAAVQGYERLLSRPDVDVVYIPLPNALHAGWTEAALSAGKHVLVEKSFTGCVATAERLTAMAVSQDLLLVENFAFLRHPQHEEVRALVADGAIGEPRRLVAEFTIPPCGPTAIRYQPELGGGALMETGTYTLRVAQLFLEPLPAVLGAVLCAGPDGGVDLTGGALLADEKGVVAHCSFGLCHSYRCGYSLLGSAGRISLDRAFTPPPDHRPRLRLERQGHHEERALAAYDQFGGLLRSVARDIERPSARRRHAADIVRQARLLDAVRSVARVHGRPGASGRTRRDHLAAHR